MEKWIAAFGGRQRLLQLLALALVFWFEPLATWLPNEVYGGG